MSSLITHEPIAIRLRNVSKIYRLHGSQGDQLIDVLGLQRFGFKTKSKPKEFAALSNVSLDVPRGHRIGIVGRNGAGKTTLLKLICGNFTPTSGELEVNGSVQALMSVGMGFHPEYTGRENIEASLQYNGLAREEYQKAMEGIIDFCELGDFLDQPFKTYSLGMQARLMFAAATAIKPDILIVDEVLGAGDAYFVAKSKTRVQKLIDSGCTMLLVSHSMQQVLELCDEAIWMDQGRIRMRGESFLVVKAYEEYIHGPISNLALPASILNDTFHNANEAMVTEIDEVPPRKMALPEEVRLQAPFFLPHSQNANIPEAPPPAFHCQAPGGVSRWDSEKGLKVVGFALMVEGGLTETMTTMHPAEFVVDLVAEIDGTFHCRYGIAINDHMGACLTRIFSPEDQFETKAGGHRRVKIMLNPCQIGPGEYTVGISVLHNGPLELLNSCRRYDLLSRSFVIRVELPDSIGALTSQFLHSAEWKFG